MKRVVVTGMGIVSSIGNNTQEVVASLREAKSGIGRADDYERLGFRCQVHGAPDIDVEPLIDRRHMRFHAMGTAWNHIAMDQAIADSGLEESDVSNPRTGIIMGSGGASTRTLFEACTTTLEKGPKRVGPFAVPKCMSSTASATLATTALLTTGEAAQAATPPANQSEPGSQSGHQCERRKETPTS